MPQSAVYYETACLPQAYLSRSHARPTHRYCVTLPTPSVPPLARLGGKPSGRRHVAVVDRAGNVRLERDNGTTRFWGRTNRTQLAARFGEALGEVSVRVYSAKRSWPTARNCHRRSVIPGSAGSEAGVPKGTGTKMPMDLLLYPPSSTSTLSLHTCSGQLRGDAVCAPHHGAQHAAAAGGQGVRGEPASRPCALLLFSCHPTVCSRGREEGKGVGIRLGRGTACIAEVLPGPGKPAVPMMSPHPAFHSYKLPHWLRILPICIEPRLQWLAAFTYGASHLGTCPPHLLPLYPAPPAVPARSARSLPHNTHRPTHSSFAHTHTRLPPFRCSSST